MHSTYFHSWSLEVLKGKKNFFFLKQVNLYSFKYFNSFGFFTGAL